MSPPVVLFVCVHNAGRSQMGAALLHHHAAGAVTVRSAGSAPADTINPVVVTAMAEIGLDVSGEIPRALTDDAEDADVVVTMGCGDACPIRPGALHLDWELDDPAGRSLEQVRTIRDDIRERVLALVGRLAGPVRIEVMTNAHADGVLAVYQAGLDTGNASFETTAPSWDVWDRNHLPRHRFVALDDDNSVIGWIAASPTSTRAVYAGVLEHSVYIHPGHHGHGIGRALLGVYIAATEAAGVWTLESGIFPENTASLALHERAGFRTLGVRERVGQHYGRWRDVILVERRSPRV